MPLRNQSPREEHSVRHNAKRSQKQSFPCSACSRIFGRSDTLRRHMRHIHGVDKPVNTKHACAHCRRAKSRCQGGFPCSECLRRGIQCSLGRRVETPYCLSGVSDIPASNAGPSMQARRYLGVYFEKFHPHWLFIHKGSFDENVESPFLIQAMVVIGLWMSDQPDTRSAAIGLHNTLALAISQQRGAWDVSAAEGLPSAKWQIPIYQGILLHIIFALMQAGADNLGVDLKPSLSQINTELLDSLLMSCKRIGMFYYPTILAQYSQSEPSRYIWLGIEETKRFNLALYKVYQSTSGIGKRAKNIYIKSKLTAADLQFPPPTNTRLWKAVSKTEWHAAAESGVFNHLLDNTMSEMWISRVTEACDLDLELYHTLQG